MTLYTLLDGVRYARFEGPTHDTYREYSAGDTVNLSLDEAEQFAPGRIAEVIAGSPAKTETELRREIESEKPVFRTTIKPEEKKSGSGKTDEKEAKNEE